MANEKKRVAVVGYGGMGGWHVKHLLKSDVCELAGIWDIKESRREVARENGIHTYTSLEDVLADKTVDIVTVAVPNELHKPLSIQALEAGKNVKERGLGNNMIDLLCADEEFGLSRDEIMALLKPENYTGRSANQVEEFIRDFIDPVIEKNRDSISEGAELKV